MSNKIEVRFSELICSKICHDLIGPLGAINNGLEFVSEDNGEFAQDASNLIEKSCKEALHKLSFYRVAFGTSRNRGLIVLGEVYRLMADFAGDRHIVLNWPLQSEQSNQKVLLIRARLILNIFYLAIECLPRGGEISLENSPKPILSEIKLEVEGSQCKLSDEVKSGLNPDLPNEKISVKNLPAQLLSQLCRLEGQKVKVENESADSVNLSIVNI